MTTKTVFIGLGSNKNNPKKQLQQGLSALDKIPDSKLKQYSKIYQNPPVGPKDQPDYLNAVAQIKTALSADLLLDTLQAIEIAHGRIKTAMRWGPRPLDLDILIFGQMVIDTPRLKVPHPQLAHRAFVLYPLFEIAPMLFVPTLGAITDLLEKVDISDLRTIK